MLPHFGTRIEPAKGRRTGPDVGIGLALVDGAEATMSDQDAISHSTSEVEAARRKARLRQAGFTLTEAIVAVYIVGLLSAIVSTGFIDKREKARLARCMVEMRGIQSAIFTYSPDGITLPYPEDFWPIAYPNGRPGPYFYLLDGDPNKGHGNDLDGLDEENPGKSWENIQEKDIQFAIICQHDHGTLGDYVYITDITPPQIATKDNDPDYERFIKWEFGGPG
jgi:prepilin-type N-terminal cleavage/methylation domain-containing protein